MSTLVRLKPFDPRRGHVMKRYTVSAWEQRFEVERGWYEVPDEWAAYLATIRQNANDPFSKDAFDVCTKEEAEAIDARELAAAQPKAGAANPYPVGPRHQRPRTPVIAVPQDPLAGAITTADLPKPSWEAPVVDGADDDDEFANVGAEEAGMSPQPAAPPPPQPASKKRVAPAAPAVKVKIRPRAPQ